MTFDEYYTAALRTLIPKGLSFDLNHSILGLTTEIGEFATLVKRNVIYGKPFDEAMLTHAREELGDILWYVPCGMQALGTRELFPLREVKSELAGCVRVMVMALGRLTTKVSAFEVDAWTAGIVSEYGFIVGAVQRAAVLLNLGAMSDIYEGNIAKLRLRYPDKFTAELAEARLDKGGADARSS